MCIGVGEKIVPGQSGESGTIPGHSDDYYRTILYSNFQRCRKFDLYGLLKRIFLHCHYCPVYFGVRKLLFL